MQNKKLRSAEEELSRCRVLQRITFVSLHNNVATELEMRSALTAAQRAHVTEFEYLYGRLLMETGIPIEEWPENRN